MSASCGLHGAGLERERRCLSLFCGGLAAGFVFDWKSRQYMGPIMYCVMTLSTTDR